MSIMSINEGGLDRTLRIVVGAILLSLAFVGPKTPWGYVGLVLIITGFTGNCPAYSIFGISTCATRRTQ